MPWDRLSLIALRLGATAFSSVLVASGLKLGSLYPDFIAGNRLATPERRSTLVLTLAAALVPVAIGLGIAVFRRGRLLHNVERVSIVLAPLSVGFVLQALLDYRMWAARPLPFLVLLTLVVWATERLGRAALAEISPSVGARSRALDILERWAPVIVVVLAAHAFFLWGAYYSLIAFRRGFHAAYDLGIYDNLMYNALLGEPFRSSVLFGPRGGNYIAGHSELAMLFFVPLYALRPGAQTLLVLQAFLIAFAALPLYLFARTQLPRWLGALVALGYLLYAPLHGPIFYDFHWLSVASFFHFWLYFGIATRRNWLIFGMLLFLLLLREDIAVGTAVLGLFLMLASERTALGIGIFALSSVWFVVNKFIIMPAAGEWWFADMYKDLMSPEERGYASVVKTLLVNPAYVLQTLLTPEKLTYVLHMLAPLAFLPLRRPALVLLACPGAFFTLLTTGYAPTLSIAFQYTVHWVPYLFAASVLALRSLAQDSPAGWVRQKAAAAALVVGMMTHSYVFGGVLQRNTLVAGFQPVVFGMTADERRDYGALRRVIRHIPEEASVAATDREVPHVSARRTCYLLASTHGDAEYLLVSRKSIDFSNTRAVFLDALRQHAYGLEAHAGPFYLFKQGVRSKRTARALRELGAEPRPSP